MQESSRLKGIFLVVLGAFLGGCSGVVSQYLFESANFTPEWLVVVRMVTSGTIILVFSLLKKDKNVFGIYRNKKNIISILIFALLGMLGMQYSYFKGILHGNAATASILEYLSPVIITIYLAFYNKKLPTQKQIVCVFMAILGTFLIITKGNFTTLAISKEAVFWGILSAFACTIYTLQPSRLLENYGTLCIIGWGMFIGGIVLSFIYPPFNCNGNWSLKSILAISFIILLGTLISFYCYIESRRYIQPYEANLFTCVESLSASILSIIFLHVSFSLIQIAGALCIFITISILSFNKNDDNSLDIKECENATN